MDFLEIRRKAKERAAARARRGAAAGAVPPARQKSRAARGRRRREVPPEDAVVTEADVVEGALMAEMQGRGEPPPADAGFVIVRGPPAAEPGRAPAARSGAPGGETAWPARTGARAPATDPLSEFFLGEGELPPAPAGAARQGAPEPLREVLVFHLGGEEYALEIEVVREILKAPPITDVPRAPAHVLGVTMVRGQVIAVHDPRRRLGLPPGEAGPGARVVVCDAGEGPVGLLVDGVSQVLRLPPSALEPRPQGIAGIDSEFITGVGRVGERFFVLLDPEPLLRRAHGGGGAA
jgi:purine-binding chemotaxis protein CheW